MPRHRFLLARFGLPALLPASALARHYFTGKRAQAFFAGMATHSVLSLKAPASAAVGLTLLAAGHASGWPILRGGAQTLSDALARYLEDLGGRIETGHELKQLPEADLILADMTPPTTASHRSLSTSLPLLQEVGAFPLRCGRLQDRLRAECSYSLGCS